MWVAPCIRTANSTNGEGGRCHPPTKPIPTHAAQHEAFERGLSGTAASHQSSLSLRSLSGWKGHLLSLSLLSSAGDCRGMSRSGAVQGGTETQVFIEPKHQLPAQSSKVILFCLAQVASPAARPSATLFSLLSFIPQRSCTIS